MNNVCCANCRLRFTPVATAQLVACPECGESLQPTRTAAGLLGFRLYTPDEAPELWLQARAAAIDISDPSGSMPVK